MKQTGQSWIGGPSIQHEQRRATLEAIGRLAGYVLHLPMPDGSIPDVALADPRSMALFIAEAKHSEPPWDHPSLVRLRRYAGWLSHEQGAGGPDVFAIGHPPEHGTGWTFALIQLARDAQVVIDRVSTRQVDPGTSVTWAKCYGGTAKATRQRRTEGLVAGCPSTSDGRPYAVPLPGGQPSVGRRELLARGLP